MRRLVMLGMAWTALLAGCGGDDKPTAPAVGSCCLTTGTCAVTTQAACRGIWTQAGTCEPNQCSQPTGSCCHASGICAVTLAVACTGTWTAFGACTPNPCAQPTGACCAVDGTCSLTTQADCSGTSTWTVNGVCDPNTCQPPPPTGSCCLLNGTCLVMTQATCGGTWTQAGVCTPNPCPATPPTGMAWIPAGTVRLGQEGVTLRVDDVYVEGFWIDSLEVSNAKYKAFIDVGGYTTEAYWNPVGWAWRVADGITLPRYWNEASSRGGGVAGNERFPVAWVSWWEADAYCRWAGKRLPTEAEWEKAAKGGCETHGDPGQCDASDTPTYPWGEEITGPQANFYQSGDPYENGVMETTPVGYYDGGNHAGYQTIDSSSPYGLYDVAGNVWEWCSSRFAPYPYDASDGRESPPTSSAGDFRVQRGGAWNSTPWDPSINGRPKCAYRLSGSPDGRGFFCGFRCARSD